MPADFKSMQGNPFTGMGAGSPGGIKVNPFAYPSEKCPECGNEVFVPGVILKKIPGVMLGVADETVSVPIKVAVCSKCGTLSAADQQKYNEETENAKKAEEFGKSASGKPTIIV